jgi:hypothetical protein
MALAPVPERPASRPGNAAPLLHTRHMGVRTYPSPRDEPQAATYWRRRFIALVIGLAVLAVITWAFSGALGGATAGAFRGGTRAGKPGGGNAPGAAAPSAGASGTPSARASPGAASASPGTSSPAASARATATSSPSARRHRPAAQAHASAGAHPASATASLGRCPVSDVVLSLFAGQGAVTAHGMPHFDVDVVSTAAQPCKFNVGARHLALVVTSGRAGIWSSADCVQGLGSLVTALQRGVPTVLPMTWDQELASPGCAGRATQVPAGTYSAVAADGALTSNSVTFRVR